MNHLHFAHSLWQAHVRPEDVVIDATCGNGHDTLFLSGLVPAGRVFAFDIQEKAIQNTQELLKKHGREERVTLLQKSHVDLQKIPSPPRLIVYNLGYLPGGDKGVTTQTDTTLESVAAGLKMLPEGGALSITCYPGHAEGAREEKALVEFLRTLPSHQWTVRYHQWVNRPKAPSLLWVVRS